MKHLAISVRGGKLLGAAVVALAGPTLAWAITTSSPVPFHHSPDRPDAAPLSGAASMGAPSRYSQSSLSHASSAGISDPEAVLDAIVARYGGSAIVDASFGGPMPGWTCTDDPAIPCPESLRNGHWLYTTVSTTASGPPSTTRAIWEANLVAGALRDELHLAGIEGDLVASNVSVRLPSGKVEENTGGGLGWVAFAQGFSDADRGSVEQQVESAADDLGLDVNSLDVLQPLQAAPAVVISVDDPKEFVAHADDITIDLFGRPPRYEGEYFQANDEAGQAVFVQAAAFRSGVGMRWVRPDLDPHDGFFRPDKN